ncbi:hypothetical protein N7448_003032 [Penicillium atrosanguineum]|uniref:HECT-type E3 ubiquitin transferase n=1 Tax=Penicillium atrosanguineum TaxID=1132637 RepID=A0A9W9H8C6_9EURO|nr:hypothetical protein N7526_008836 [Penicillium atrosanguineum]KAJ5139624.1 hypothetical protein N7448_003032 [Penicillium atrosanguineum]KAJ5315066.1 hypothetical protein N7476_005373 [Penicillium atrosanguineum]
MPSWSGRNPPILPIASPSTALPSTPHTVPASDHSQRRPSHTHNAPNMVPLNTSLHTGSHRRGHHRSISHPFTSPFTGIAKKRDKAGPKYTTWESDSDSDVTVPTQPNSASPRKEAKVGQGNELTEGKCQTCNSTVRWPRNSHVFRCTSCLMVTDLEAESPKDLKSPGALENEDRARGARKRDPAEQDSVLSPHEPKPDIILSANSARRMLDGCLSMYFDRLLEGPKSHLTPDDNRNGRHYDPQMESPLSPPARSPDYGHLSVPRHPHSRSVSASSERERATGTNGSSSFLKPQAVQWEAKNTPTRPRANSNLQSESKTDQRPQQPARPTETKNGEHQPLIFKRLENYIITAFKGTSVLNMSFSTCPPAIRSASSGNPPRMNMDPASIPEQGREGPDTPVFEIDAKTLLLGDLAENSSWWMNEWAQREGQVPSSSKDKPSHRSRMVSSRSPRINWAEVAQWYQLVLTAGSAWAQKWDARKPDAERSEADMIRSKRWESIDRSVLEKEICESRVHLQRTLMKAVENLLKRPRCVLKKPEDTRFLFILLANPLLTSPTAFGQTSSVQAPHRDERRPFHPKDTLRSTTRDGKTPRKDPPPPVPRYSSPNHHHGITKRILGLMSNLPNECHHYLVSWFSRFSHGQFERLVDLAGGFITYRLTRQHGRKRNQPTKDGDDLIPSFASASGNTPAELHAAINRRGQKPPPQKKEEPMVYTEDWQIRGAARVMSLLFTANNTHSSRKPDDAAVEPRGLRHADSAVTQSARQQGYMVPISSFYNTLLDYSDLLADFETWESRVSKFSFCQYPFLLSIWAKIHILEHDARRQMEVKAREAFFNSILNHRAVSQYLVLKVRRECLVEDSLRSVSEVVGTGHEEIKKGLRIEFIGEEGIDAGGLRKEWFLLLVREVFDPHHGLFVYDEDSQYCYFNPHCFESSEQFFLVGVLLGLAIYNSTILDIDLPPFAFKKLLAAAPQATGPASTNASRPRFKCTLEDLAEYRPALAKGLRMLLDYDGDVAETFCYDFVAQVDRYGEVVNVPLCAGGESRPVTNSNRREFVDLYVHYFLESSVTRQFEPFKRGFFTVCGGNALSLFRPEEIELLIRGSDETLDVNSLRAVATYDNWSSPRPESLPVVQWFWDFFEMSPPQAQRKILSFITGSDRIPAMGATSLSIRLACLGDDCSRYPTARTCFNTLGLYRYGSQAKLQQLLWDAVVNSEGFGLK